MPEITITLTAEERRHLQARALIDLESLDRLPGLYANGHVKLAERTRALWDRTLRVLDGVAAEPEVEITPELREVAAGWAKDARLAVDEWDYLTVEERNFHAALIPTCERIEAVA